MFYIWIVYLHGGCSSRWPTVAWSETVLLTVCVCDTDKCWDHDNRQAESWTVDFRLLGWQKKSLAMLKGLLHNETVPFVVFSKVVVVVCWCVLLFMGVSYDRCLLYMCGVRGVHRWFIPVVAHQQPAAKWYIRFTWWYFLHAVRGTLDRLAEIRKVRRPNPVCSAALLFQWSCCFDVCWMSVVKVAFPIRFKI